MLRSSERRIEPQPQWNTTQLPGVRGIPGRFKGVRGFQRGTCGGRMYRCNECPKGGGKSQSPLAPLAQRSDSQFHAPTDTGSGHPPSGCQRPTGGPDKSGPYKDCVSSSRNQRPTRGQICPTQPKRPGGISPATDRPCRLNLQKDVKHPWSIRIESNRTC